MSKVGSAPDVPATIAPAFLTGLIGWITRELRARPLEGQPASSVLLVSPDRSVYSVTVGNTGTLSTTKVSGG